MNIYFDFFTSMSVLMILYCLSLVVINIFRRAYNYLTVRNDFKIIKISGSLELLFVSSVVWIVCMTLKFGGFAGVY